MSQIARVRRLGIHCATNRGDDPSSFRPPHVIHCGAHTVSLKARSDDVVASLCKLLLGVSQAVGPSLTSTDGLVDAMELCVHGEELSLLQ